MSDTDERDRAGELVEFIKYEQRRHAGAFGTGMVLITTSAGERLVCGLDDLLEAVRRIVEAAKK